MFNRRLMVLVGVLLTLSAHSAFAEGRRVALVIGIGGYEAAPKLPKAVDDASAMADLFRKAGFEIVAARSDLSNIDFKQAIRAFADSAADADIAVVYYAGHGIDIRGTNYLIPTDAKLLDELDAPDEAIPLDRVLDVLDGAKRLRLVILDACRDNPFANTMRRRVASSVGLGKVVPQQANTLIAYAAKAQAVADDGTGGHSPFTTALLTDLTVPGLDIRLALGRVRAAVLKATNEKQEPFAYGVMNDDVLTLVPSTGPVVASDEQIAGDFSLIKRVDSQAAWKVFLNTYQSGSYVDIARRRLFELQEYCRLGRDDAGRAYSCK